MLQAGPGVCQAADSPLVINEVMASNNSGVTDPQNEYDDWIEIYNAGTIAVDVAGMYVTDDLGDPTKWRFPLNQPELTASKGAAGDPNDPNTEYIELTNIGAPSINLSLVRFTDGVGFSFDDGWFRTADGGGFSLTVKDPRTADPNALGDKAAWRPSGQEGGSPGASDLP
jgi:hypothetical protein